MAQNVVGTVTGGPNGIVVMCNGAEYAVVDDPSVAQKIVTAVIEEQARGGDPWGLQFRSELLAPHARAMPSVQDAINREELPTSGLEAGSKSPVSGAFLLAKIGKLEQELFDLTIELRTEVRDLRKRVG